MFDRNSEIKIIEISSCMPCTATVGGTPFRHGFINNSSALDRREVEFFYSYNVSDFVVSLTEREERIIWHSCLKCYLFWRDSPLRHNTQLHHRDLRCFVYCDGGSRAILKRRFLVTSSRDTRVCVSKGVR